MSLGNANLVDMTRRKTSTRKVNCKVRRGNKKLPLRMRCVIASKSEVYFDTLHIFSCYKERNASRNEVEYEIMNVNRA
jgi:hypothetical protein